MSLDFSVERIADFQEKFPDRVHGALRRWNEDIELLAMTTMHVDMGEITEANVEEFWIRMKIVNSITPLFQKREEETDEWSPYVPTLERTREAIGLKTNVVTYTRHQFMMALKPRMERTEKELRIQ